MPIRLSLALALVFAFTVQEAVFACSIPKPGVSAGKESIVDRSNVIVLVEVGDVERHKDGSATYSLKVVKVIKGQAEERYIVQASDSDEFHYGNHFNDHKDPLFWEREVGRSEFQGCVPDHTFVIGETYLLFPDMYAAMMSAEIIRSENDDWYKFVVARVRN